MGSYIAKITPNNEEIEVEVDYYYSPAEPPSRDNEYGGCPAEFYINSIIHGDIDIYKYIHEDVIDKLEEEILKYLKEW